MMGASQLFEKCQVVSFAPSLLAIGCLLMV